MWSLNWCLTMSDEYTIIDKDNGYSEAIETFDKPTDLYHPETRQTITVPPGTYYISGEYKKVN